MVWTPHCPCIVCSLRGLRPRRAACQTAAWASRTGERLGGGFRWRGGRQGGCTPAVEKAVLFSYILLAASLTIRERSLSYYVHIPRSPGLHRRHRERVFLPAGRPHRGRAIRTREQEVVHRREARALSRVVEPSQLVISQREVPVASFHIRAGALEHLRERFGLVLELRLLQRA